jgi:thioredoxin 1
MKKSIILGTAMGLVLFLLISCQGKADTSGRADASASAVSEQTKVTFIELGSVNCVPCKAMQPIMDDLRKEYPRDVKVVFYDVWTPAGRPYGQKFGIRVIPTQVFLDAEGKEFLRHEGFFPKDQLVQVLKKKGVEK